MISTSDNQRRRAFSIWLRTGRLPSAKNADGIELKFNPWHDPENGRFTFAGAGRQYGQWGGGRFPGGGGGRGGGGGATAAGVWPAPSRRPKSQPPAKRGDREKPKDSIYSGERPSSSKPSGQNTWMGGGLTVSSGSGAGGGEAAGTSGSSGRVTSQRSTISNSAGTTNDRARPASSSVERFRTVVRNGYTYELDLQGRTRRVSGALTVADVPVRSPSSQRQAGGTDRRINDDGGHYIAARFNGPTEAFNHFAQNANFNRGGYRLLEDEWARDKRAGRVVMVRIVPQFAENSVCPSTINVWWWVDGREKSVRFQNEPSEKRRDGR